MGNAGNPKSHPLCPPDFPLVIGFFSCAAPKRKETRLNKTLQKKKTQRQVKNLHCTCIPNPQNSKNIKITTQNVKIIPKSIKIFEKYKKSSKKNTKSKGNRPKANA